MQKLLTISFVVLFPMLCFSQAKELTVPQPRVKFDWSDRIHFEIKGVDQPDTLRVKQINLQPYLHLLGENPLEVTDSLSQYTVIIYPYSRKESGVGGLITIPQGAFINMTQKAMPE